MSVCGSHARSQRLEVLRRADFTQLQPSIGTAPRHDTRVVAHVLRLERRHAMPRRAATRHSAVASQLLPAPLLVPQTTRVRVMAR
jgi:hypothetical protein